MCSDRVLFAWFLSTPLGMFVKYTMRNHYDSIVIPERTLSEFKVKVFDRKIPIETAPYLDDTFFVLFFGVVVVLLQSIGPQLLLKTALMSLYTYRKTLGKIK